MKMLYMLLVFTISMHPMLRSRNQHIPSRSTRAYSSGRSVQIKVTNPKLIASLEAARKYYENAPQSIEKKQPCKSAVSSIICTDRSEKPKQYRSHSTADRSYSEKPKQYHSHVTDDHTYVVPTANPLVELADIAADSYVTYKIGQGIDRIISHSDIDDDDK